jgi:hypothetical protein
MQVGDEADLEVYRLKSVYTFVARCRGSPDQPGSKIHEIRSAVDDNCCARPATLWVWQRSSGSQQNNLRFSCRLGLRMRVAKAGQEN